MSQQSQNVPTISKCPNNLKISQLTISKCPGNYLKMCQLTISEFPKFRMWRVADIYKIHAISGMLRKFLQMTQIPQLPHLYRALNNNNKQKKGTVNTIMIFDKIIVIQQCHELMSIYRKFIFNLINCLLFNLQ